MLKTTLTFACAAIALVITANANAQDCGGCGTSVNYGGYGMVDAGTNNCGRQISSQAAASLWAGYCTETCVSGRQGCGLFSGGRAGGCGTGNMFGYPTGACNGCFGYPSACGCGTGIGSGGGCGLFSKLRSGGGCNLFSKFKSCGAFTGCGLGGGYSYGSGSCFGYGGCGTGGCGIGGCNLGGGLGLFSKLRSGGGCNLFGKLKGRHAGASCPVSTVAIDQCGCGNTGQYFNYAVGAEYGTAGIQSSVSGMLTGECCGGSTNSVIDTGIQAYGNTGAAPIGGGCCN